MNCVGSMMSAFTMDVIARVAFGLDLNTQKEKYNIFVKYANMFAELGIAQIIFMSSKYISLTDHELYVVTRIL